MQLKPYNLAFLEFSLRDVNSAVKAMSFNCLFSVEIAVISLLLL